MKLIQRTPKSKAFIYILRRWNSTEQKDERPFFVTTPIFYVNSIPHIGHVYTALLADAQIRFQKIRRASETFLSTGTDENGMKIYQAANSQRLSPQTFCDGISKQFKDTFRSINISSDSFVRTTSKEHATAVTHFYKTLNSRGYIYSGAYEGWYCTSDEMFVPQVQVTDVKDSTGKTKKISTLSGQVVEWMSEKNYLFKLSQFKDDLLSWLGKDGVVIPHKFQELLIKDINEGLHDISVSRDRNRVPWGIPVPDDESQTIYVWLDALVNYLTVRQYPVINAAHWPPDFHVIGKEILKFHGIYWPAFLIAAGMEPPKRLLVHSHWLVNHEKMSKSKGNVVDPKSRIQCYSPEGLRYYLLREGVPHSDCNYSDAKVGKILNAELANTLGNLLNRCTSKTLNPGKKFPAICRRTFQQYCLPQGEELINQTRSLIDVVDAHYSQFNYYHGLEAIMAVLRQTNTFLQEQKPWEFKRDELRLSTTIGVAMEILRVCGILLQPVVPVLSDKLLSRLGIDSDQRQWKHARQNFITIEKEKTSDVKEREILLGNDKGVFFERIKAFEESKSTEKITALSRNV